MQRHLMMSGMSLSTNGEIEAISLGKEYSNRMYGPL
jgi:hypothetical protein